MPNLLAFVALCFTCVSCGLVDPDRSEWSQIGLAETARVTALVQTDWGLFAGTQFDGVFRLNRTWGTWESLGLGHAVIQSLLFIPGDADRLFAAVAPYDIGHTTEAGLYLSTDQGKSWVPADGGLARQRDGRFGVHSVAVDPGPPERHFLGLSYSILRSEDGGQSWTSVFLDEEDSGGQGVFCILFSSERDGRMWASLQSPLGASMIARSSDWGSSWQYTFPFPLWDAGYYDLLEDPDMPTTLWAAGDGGVLRSNDEGETWVRSLSEDAAVVKLLVVDGALLAVGGHTRFPDAENEPVSETLRLYRLRRGADTWEDITVPSEIGAARSATLDENGRLVVGTLGTGVWRWNRAVR